MSREIKFRAWNKRLKRMFSVYCINWQTGIIQCTDCITGTSHTFGMIDCELMQFTGLKDKNGVEIYEGSIVKVVVTDGPGCGESICEVIYKDNGFFAKAKRSYGDIHYDFSNRERWNDGQCSGVHLITYEVIGNIHQNPELLTKN